MKTNVHFVIDASGSMASQVEDVIGGFNEYVGSLRRGRKRGIDFRFSAILFNTEVRPLFANLEIDQVPALNRETYVPGGGTALLDAVGQAMDEIRGSRFQRRSTDRPYGDGSEKHLFVIMTDGEENSSRRYTNPQVRGKIERRQSTGWWTFVFLGADEKAWHQSMTWNIPPGNTTTWNNAHQTSTNMAGATIAYAAANTTSSTNFVNEFYDPATTTSTPTTIAPRKNRRKKA